MICFPPKTSSGRGGWRRWTDGPSQGEEKVSGAGGEALSGSVGESECSRATTVRVETVMM
jgi:hypothetical protein